MSAKTLILTNLEQHNFLAQLRWLFLYKGIEEVDFLVYHRDSGFFKKLAKINNYDHVWLGHNQYYYCKDRWEMIEFAFLHFWGILHRGGLPGMLARHEMREVWKQSGFRAQPRWVMGPVKKLPPFGPKCLVRRPLGHKNDSHATLISSMDELYNWCSIEQTSFDYLIEEFIDTSVDGVFYDGRVCKIGSVIIPEMTKWSKYWNPPHAPIAYTKYFKKGSIAPLEEATRRKLDLKEFFPYFQVLGSDIAALDFSVNHSGEIVPWEVVPFFALHDSECSLSEDEVNDQQLIINTIFETLGLEARVSYDDVYVMLATILKNGIRHFCVTFWQDYVQSIT